MKNWFGGKPVELAVFSALFLLFIAAAITSNFWHAMPMANYVGPAVSLKEYDSAVFEGEQSCQTLEFYPTEYDINKVEKILFYSKDRLLAQEKVAFTQNKQEAVEKKICFDTSGLGDGNNVITILAYSNTLFYHVEKKQGKREAGSPEIEIAGITGDTIEFSARNMPYGRVAPIEITVNGKLDHRLYPNAGQEKFSEKVSLSDGKNIVEVLAGGVKASAEAEKQGSFSMPFVLGIAIITIALFVFFCFFFQEMEFWERLAMSFASVVASFILSVFVLGLAGALNIFSFLAVFLLLLLGIAVVFRKRFSLSMPKALGRIDRTFLFTAAAFLVISIFFHLFTFQHMTYWNGFYERLSLMVREQNAIPTADPLSYFGRGYSFVPGYFYFNTGIAWVSGLEGSALFALIMVFSNALFFLAVYCLGKSLGLSEKQSSLFALLTISEGFLLTAVTLSPRHSLAFALFALSLVLYFRKRNTLLTGATLGIASFIQLPLIIFFPAFAFIASKKFEAKRAFAATAIAALCFLAFYSPSLARYGLPYQTESGNWGYLITFPLWFLSTDFAPMFALFASFYLIDILRKRIEFTPYTKKLFIAALVGLLIQATISYRYNVITALNIALLLSIWFPYKKLEDLHFERLCFIFVIAAFWYSLSNVNAIPDIGLSPMQYLKANTSTNARILSDPLYGHSITYFSGRGVMADLMVEYANKSQLEDAYAFIEKKDYAILGKYSIDYVLNQSNYINREAMDGTPMKEPIEFSELDKIYGNSFIFIHRNRGQ
ncbi:MAG: hypothetical protein V1493_02780 [Candidatus Diapherotrites archaeon]